MISIEVRDIRYNALIDRDGLGFTLIHTLILAAIFN